MQECEVTRIPQRSERISRKQGRLWQVKFPVADPEKVVQEAVEGIYSCHGEHGLLEMPGMLATH
jgi:hypothetical protein